MKTLPNDVIQVLQGYYTTLQDLEQPNQVIALQSILKRYKIAIPQKAPAEPLILKNVSLEIIEYFVCIIFVIEPGQLREKTRKHEILIPRQTVYYLCRKYLTERRKISFQRLAVKYGQNHETAIHGCKVIRELIETKEPRWSVLINQAEELIRSLNEKGEKFNRARSIA